MTAAARGLDPPGRLHVSQVSRVKTVPATAGRYRECRRARRSLDGRGRSLARIAAGLALVAAAGLPVGLPGDLDPRHVVAAVGTDKKAREGTVTFVCVDVIGRTRLERLSAREIASYLTE